MARIPIEYRLDFGRFGISDTIRTIFLLNDLTKDMETTTGAEPTEKLIVCQSETNTPSLYGYTDESGDSYHLMRLVPDLSNPLGSFVFQLSHEYTHHIIKKIGKTSGSSRLLWFEEMLCHIASFCFPLRLAQSSGNPLLSQIPSMGIPDEHISTYTSIFQDIQNGVGISRQLDLLSEQGGNPPGYCLIPAMACQPLFAENPNLWKIVGHFRDIPQNVDIFETFAHLRETADNSYRASLGKMIALLLP